MTNAQKLQIKLSETRQRLNALSVLESPSADETREMEALSGEYQSLEVRHRAAIIAEDADIERAKGAHEDMNAEQRERVELRSKAYLGAFLKAALAGKQVTGAEAELQAACGIDGIPLELWDVPETRADATTNAPGTVGVNLDVIRPAVFANSIASRLGIEMPRVGTGTYATATVSTSLTAKSHAKGSDAQSTAAAFKVNSVTPKRISARLAIRIEDIAAVGQANFEAALRQNLSLVLSDELDDQALNGAGGNAGADLNGIFQALTNPTDPTAVADFDTFVSAFAGGVDGLWALTTKDIGVVCGPATYQISAKTFRDVGTNNGHRGDIAFSDYAMAHTGGWWTNKRMPDAASTIQQAILYRKGRSMMGGSGRMRTAVCPHWNELSIDDIYTGAAKGERYFTMHVLLGDVILVQPDAYAQVAFKVSA